MASVSPKITSLPTRYEPLVRTFGDKANNTFVSSDSDMAKLKKVVASVQSSGQGKILFLSGRSGLGKSTFIHSLEMYIPDYVSKVIRVPLPHDLPLAEIPAFISKQPITPQKITVVNFDGREAPLFDEDEYKTFLGALNSVLRSRSDLLLIWPVNDSNFATKVVGLLSMVGGKSMFASEPIIPLEGLKKQSYMLALEKILQVANWKLEDAAIGEDEVNSLIANEQTVGDFLDSLQQLIVSRFETDKMGVQFPTLSIIISSSNSEIREMCRSLRRADSFYIEATRLLMYTKKSNVAEWWFNRSNDLKCALPHVIALFNAQLVSLSSSAVVHSVLQHGNDEYKSLVVGVRSDKGNAKRVIEASELYRFVSGIGADNREYGSNLKPETIQSYNTIQKKQEELGHKDLNKSILGLLNESFPLVDLKQETQIRTGLQSDATYLSQSETISLEFHHKSPSEASQNKIAIYILEKLKEYAINYGLAQR